MTPEQTTPTEYPQWIDDAWIDYLSRMAGMGVDANKFHLAVAAHALDCEQLSNEIDRLETDKFRLKTVNLDYAIELADVEKRCAALVDLLDEALQLYDGPRIATSHWRQESKELADKIRAVVSAYREAHQ